MADEINTSAAAPTGTEGEAPAAKKSKRKGKKLSLIHI